MEKIGLYATIVNNSMKEVFLLEKYCRKNNINNYEIFVDQVKNRLSEIRPSLDKLKACAKEGSINKVIVPNISNIGRNSKYTLDQLYFFKNNNCKVIDIYNQDLIKIAFDMQTFYKIALITINCDKSEEEKEMNEEKNRNNINQVVLEGNVGGFGTPYEVANGKKRLRFDLAQTRGGRTQFVPIILPTQLVETYGKEIKKGDWVSITGSINTYNKEVEKDGKTLTTKSVDIIAFEIEDKKQKITYQADGQVINNSREEMER